MKSWYSSPGGTECFKDDEDYMYNTPPESPDDVSLDNLDLAPTVSAELNDLQATEEYIKKNQEWIARSAGFIFCFSVNGDLFYATVELFAHAFHKHCTEEMKKFAVVCVCTACFL